jgi:hypothetical protein
MAAHAQESQVTVRSSVEPQEVELGRSVVVRIAATHKVGERVRWPAAPALGAAFEEVSRRHEAGPERDGLVTSQLFIEAMVFDLSVREIPPLEIGLEGALGATVQSRSLPMRVTGHVDVANSQLRPLSPPVDVPVRNTRLLLMLGTIPVLFMLIVLGYPFFRRRRATAPAAANRKEVRLPAYEEAIARFELLEESGLFEEADLKKAFLAMSEIVRDYLGRRFEFSSLDLTTSEIQSRLEAVSAEGEPWKARVIDWLSSCDLVKFAKTAADGEEARDALERARVLVKRSTDAKDHVLEVASA